MLNRLMLLLGHSCISVIGADMYIWLYYKRVCLFNAIQCYIVVEQKSVTPTDVYRLANSFKHVYRVENIISVAK